MPWKISWKFSTVTSLPCDTSPRSGRVVRKIGRRELGQEVLGQVEVEVEPLEPRELLDLHLREEHAARFVVGVRQRQEALGEQASVADLVGRHRRPASPRSCPRAACAVGPTGIGLPRVIFTFWSGRGVRS